LSNEPTRAWPAWRGWPSLEAEPPIFLITGSPAVGKSTVSVALMNRFPKGLHIAVDDLREWVVSGISHPTDWCDETERQFRLAENSAMDVALRYQAAGFAVAIDGCRRLPALDELAQRCEGRPLHKIVLMADLETNHHRNRTRTGKNFLPEELIGLIEILNPMYFDVRADHPDWHFIETGEVGVEDVVDQILNINQEP